MSTNFPTSLDTFLNPAGSDALSNATPGLQHHVQHDNENDSIAALETKVGVDGSAVATSLDYLSKNMAAIDPGHKHTPASLPISVVTKTSNYPITTADSIILANGTITITLPTAVGISGRQFTIKNITTSLTVTVATTSSQTIDGNTAPLTIGPKAAMLVVSDGANWWVI